MTVPGVNLTVAATFLAAVGDIRRRSRAAIDLPGASRGDRAANRVAKVPDPG